MKSYGLSLAGAVALAVLSAAVPATAQQPQGKKCDTPEHRQFDFWVGDWEVFDANTGEPAGTNRIELILDNCVIQEHWESANSRGESYNIYSATEKKWHQTWVDSNGSLLTIDGAFEDGRMVLSGEHLGRQGGMVLHEISYEIVEDGNVKQHWRASRDNGKEWQDLFVGIYKKK